MSGETVDRPPEHLSEMIGAEVASKLGFDFYILDAETNTCTSIGVPDSNPPRRVVIVELASTPTILIMTAYPGMHEVTFVNCPRIINLQNPEYTIDRIVEIARASMADDNFKAFGTELPRVDNILRAFGVEY